MERVRVTEFTDPYSTWCWGAEPIRRRLEEVYRDQVRFEFVMGGLMEDFDAFSDPVNDVATDDEVAPHWSAASQRHGMPVDVGLWREDPPSSTYPACIAYEAATFQGREPAHAFLRRMREAGAAERANLERTSVLADLAGEVGLDVEQFRADVDSEAAVEAFRKDRNAAADRGATAFPTFLVEAGDREELLRGYRPVQAFEKVFTEASMALERHEPRPVATLLEEYGRLATREVADMRGCSTEAARESLSELAAAGQARAVEAGTGCFWEPV